VWRHRIPGNFLLNFLSSQQNYISHKICINVSDALVYNLSMLYANEIYSEHLFPLITTADSIGLSGSEAVPADN
jgi:hypothetical protein